MERNGHILSGLGASLARYGRTFSPTGLAFALTFYCISMTPSLIPREWLYQALLTGLSVIGGYAIGTFLGWVLRRFGFRTPWPPSVTRVLWWGLALATVVLVPWFLVLGSHWQNDLRTLFGMEPPGPLHTIPLLGLALLLALVLLEIGRTLRRCTRWAARVLGRWVPLRVARLVAAVAVTAVTIVVVNGGLIDGTLSALNSVYAKADETTPAGAVRPTSPERSGSPESLASWETLGKQGRGFVSGGPSVAQIQDFVAGGDVIAPADVMEPIRVYAGLDSAATDSAPDSAESLQATAELVVAELDRTNAWDRDILVVTTTTGTGWVDPSMSQSLEYMHGGNTATAAMQYSFLPSWISFVSDMSTPPAAGKALYEAVYAAWSAKPADDRPFLLAFGISLGSYGAQGAFSGLQDMSARTDGALFVGTPNATANWQFFTDNRDPGSLEYSPVYEEGRQVRFGTEVGSAANIWDFPGTWQTPHIVYIQHASDAIVWWSPDLLWREADWISQPGPDRMEMTWVPIVTFWQVTFDLFVAGDVPSGHGHDYREAYVDGLAALGAPQGWDTQETTRLRDLLGPQASQG